MWCIFYSARVILSSESFSGEELYDFDSQTVQVAKSQPSIGGGENDLADRDRLMARAGAGSYP
jgi:hypothetical protein